MEKAISTNSFGKDARSTHKNLLYLYILSMFKDKMKNER